MVDSHCHLDMEPLSDDLESVIERAGRAGVEDIINIGSSVRGSEKSLKISETYPNIWATVGIHPHDAETTTNLDDAIGKIGKLSEKEKVVAIGEIGLDYYTESNSRKIISNEKKGIQKKLFEAQIKIAEEKNLPIVFHIRDAWDDFFKMMEKTKYSVKKGGVVHCYTGDEKKVKKITKLGFYLGFTGFVTFEQNKFDYIRRAAKETPLDRLLIETDAPFLAPEPYRGKRNEPAFVLEIAKKIAELRGVKFEKIAKSTTKNAKNLFNIE